VGVREVYPDCSIGSPDERPELAPMLASRAEILLELAEDDSLWDEETYT
jgi:hypothetical protein